MGEPVHYNCAMEEKDSSPKERKVKPTRERIWVTRAVKERLESWAEANNSEQEKILDDILEFYELSTQDSLQTSLPELELSIAVLNAELSRLLHLLELLEDTVQSVPELEQEAPTVAS
jgi:hypothetical protein